MRATAKKYNTSYKGRTDKDRDTYLPTRSPKGIMQCIGCGSLYYRRRWTLTPIPAFNLSAPQAVYCPACRKIKNHRASGEVLIAALDRSERKEILNILRNEEARARDENPLERIMSLKQANGAWKIQTTTEKLAQRLGRAMKKAKGGKVVYNWSHNNKFVRVTWKKKAAAPQQIARK